MGWPTIPPALVASDQVTIRRAGGWTQDASGGRVRNLGAVVGTYSCAFKPVSRIALHGHASNHRDMMVGRYTATFANVSPNLHLNDEIAWLNENKVLIVVEVETAGTSDARLWVAHVEERPAV